MDWNLKATSWDLTEFKQEAIPNIDAFQRTSSEEFSVDLKLGRVGSNSNDESTNQWKQPRVSKTESSPSISTKRARATNGTQAAFCLVDGCSSDLSNCRDYHRRHKVCELHSKSPQVTIGGLKQRFCQQCSRYCFWVSCFLSFLQNFNLILLKYLSQIFLGGREEILKCERLPFSFWSKE